MSEAQQLPLAIEALIAGRLQELKLTPVELVRRCGYKNLSKGLRRLEGVREGYFGGQDGFFKHCRMLWEYRRRSSRPSKILGAILTTKRKRLGGRPSSPRDHYHRA